MERKGACGWLSHKETHQRRKQTSARATQQEHSDRIPGKTEEKKKTGSTGLDPIGSPGSKAPGLPFELHGKPLKYTEKDRLSPTMLASIQAPVPVLATPFLIQLPAMLLRK